MASMEKQWNHRKPLGTPGSLDTCRCGTKAKKVSLNGGGKLRFRHKCPHGKWCEHGDKLNGKHANYNSFCGQCKAELLKRRHEADEGYQKFLRG